MLQKHKNAPKNGAQKGDFSKKPTGDHTK